MVLQLQIIGYYGHYNTGDEQYKKTFLNLFDTYITNEYNAFFHDCDKIANVDFSDGDIIIIGGGDVLNSYFLDKIIKKFQNKKNKIVAISVGIPYIETLIQTEKINIIDYVFLRTRVDIELFYKYFSKERVFYLPDLSCMLLNEFKIKGKDIENYNDVSAFRLNITTKYVTDLTLELYNRIKNKKSVCFCLSRHIYNVNYLDEYNNVLVGLCQFIEFLISENYHIIFVPFNTCKQNPNENDILIAKDVVNKLKLNDSHFTLIEKELTSNEILAILCNVDLCVPMRFHACLFSMYCYTPIIPIYTTRKIFNLMKETNWQYNYYLPVNEKCIPIKMESSILIDIYTSLLKANEFRQNIYHKLLYINTNLFDMYDVSKLVNLIMNKPKGLETKKCQNINIKIDELYNIVKEFALSKGYNDFRLVKDDNLQNTIVYIISYNLTDGTINSIYNYGLKEKIFDTTKTYDYLKEWKWIINDCLNKKDKLTSNSRGLFDMEYIDQVDYSGAHRSGWQYVYKHIEFLHNKSSPLLLDLYIDRTFHWNREINKILKIIPYKKSWVGFVHHTFDTSFSEYNCKELLRCTEFIESLDKCKGIFVLSSYLKDQFDKEFQKMNLEISVYKLTHPTESNVANFSYKSFFENKSKCVIHIGGWLRNVYSFYNLVLPKTIKCKYGFLYGDKSNVPMKIENCAIQKIALRGKNMNNYYPENNLTDNIKNSLIYTKSQNVELIGESLAGNCSVGNCSVGNSLAGNCSVGNCSVGNSLAGNCSVGNSLVKNCSVGNCLDDNNNGLINNWHKHFYEDLCNKNDTVKFIEYLENDDYDKLMTENIIFINLVDASAVNTIIECIVRTTPIIINKHPAVVELLGEEYPLYFKSRSNDYASINIEIDNLLKTDCKIRKAHKYLRNIKKDVYKIDNFVDSFTRILKVINSELNI